MRLTFEGTPLEFYEQFGFRPDMGSEVIINSNTFRIHSLEYTSNSLFETGRLIVDMESTSVKKRVSRKGNQKDFNRIFL